MPNSRKLFTPTTIKSRVFPGVLQFSRIAKLWTIFDPNDAQKLQPASCMCVRCSTYYVQEPSVRRVVRFRSQNNKLVNSRKLFTPTTKISSFLPEFCNSRELRNSGNLQRGSLQVPDYFRSFAILENCKTREFWVVGVFFSWIAFLENCKTPEKTGVFWVVGCP